MIGVSSSTGKRNVYALLHSIYQFILLIYPTTFIINAEIFSLTVFHRRRELVQSKFLVLHTLRYSGHLIV